MTAKSPDAIFYQDLDVPARWEVRTAKSVPDSERDQWLERSRLIVDAANELVKEEGLEGLTIRGILNKTGLSRRAFYERFAGKDDLALAVFEETIRLASRHYREIIRPVDDPLGRLRMIVVSIVLGKKSPDDVDNGAGDRRGAAMSREHMRLAESRPDDLEDALRPLIGLIALQLSEGMDKGVVRRANPLRLARLVYNLVSTTVHTELLAQESGAIDHSHREELARDIWQFCRRAVVI